MITLVVDRERIHKEMHCCALSGGLVRLLGSSKREKRCPGHRANRFVLQPPSRMGRSRDSLLYGVSRSALDGKVDCISIASLSNRLDMSGGSLSSGTFDISAELRPRSAPLHSPRAPPHAYSVSNAMDIVGVFEAYNVDIPGVRTALTPGTPSPGVWGSEECRLRRQPVLESYLPRHPACGRGAWVCCFAHPWRTEPPDAFLLA